LAGIQKFTSRTFFFEADSKLARVFLKKKRGNLTSTSIKVVPLTATSMSDKFQQEILQFGYATAQKLLTLQCAHSLFDGKAKIQR
jgi:hypothetical protein